MVEMQEIVNLALNSGTAVIVIGYFMYRDFKFMSTLQTTLTTLVETVNTLKTYAIGFRAETEMNKKEV